MTAPADFWNEDDELFDELYWDGWLIDDEYHD